MTDALYSKTYHTNKSIEYLINVYIREYDIRRAGPSALLVGGCIDQNYFKYLCNLPRQQRQIQTGLLIKQHPEFDKIRSSIIEESRKQFLDSNGFSESDILSIKNDAIYVIEKTPSFTSFYDNRIEFIPKNVYTSYYRYLRTEMYYFIDIVNQIERIDIKNIGDDKIARHSDFMLDFLLCLFDTAQNSSTADVIKLLQDMMTNYVSHNLPLGYYREFNARSEFKFNLSEFTDYYAAFLPDNTDLNLLNIDYNLKLLRFFYSVFSNIYFANNKG